MAGNDINQIYGWINSARERAKDVSDYTGNTLKDSYTVDEVRGFLAGVLTVEQGDVARPVAIYVLDMLERVNRPAVRPVEIDPGKRYWMPSTTATWTHSAGDSGECELPALSPDTVAIYSAASGLTLGADPSDEATDAVVTHLKAHQASSCWQ